MARFREDFSLYSRTMKDGREVWYYRAYTEDGRRIAISTGKTSKTGARKHCNALLKEGRLIPPKVKVPTLGEWAEREKWWRWGECKYLHGQLARSDPERPAVSRRYADDALKILEDYILPAHGTGRLDKITPADCEALLFQWESDGLSKKTVNNRASIYRIMLTEAERLGIIARNPWDRVRSFKPASHPRGILTREEARRLLNPATVETIWGGNRLTYCANLLASVTACRLGEVLGLTREHLFPDHIHVSQSWKRKYGTGPVKTKRVDDIPIPRFVYDEIEKWSQWDGFVFSYCQGRKPAEPSRINDALRAAMAEIGIVNDAAHRKEKRAPLPGSQQDRNLSFHSWRAFANTFMRGRGIADAKVRQLTRHTSEAMTEHYTAFNPEDFADVAAAQDALVAYFTERIETENVDVKSHGGSPENAA